MIFCENGNLFRYMNGYDSKLIMDFKEFEKSLNELKSIDMSYEDGNYKSFNLKSKDRIKHKRCENSPQMLYK